jgi:hypothetical protein
MGVLWLSILISVRRPLRVMEWAEVIGVIDPSSPGSAAFVC